MRTLEASKRLQSDATDILPKAKNAGLGVGQSVSNIHAPLLSFLSLRSSAEVPLKAITGQLRQRIITSTECGLQVGDQIVAILDTD